MARHGMIWDYFSRVYEIVFVVGGGSIIGEFRGWLMSSIRAEASIVRDYSFVITLAFS